jgi:hypothetical protein
MTGSRSVQADGRPNVDRSPCTKKEAPIDEEVNNDRDESGFDPRRRLPA